MKVDEYQYIEMKYTAKDNDNDLLEETCVKEVVADINSYIYTLERLMLGLGFSKDVILSVIRDYVEQEDQR